MSWFIPNPVPAAKSGTPQLAPSYVRADPTPRPSTHVGTDEATGARFGHRYHDSLRPCHPVGPVVRL